MFKQLSFFLIILISNQGFSQQLTGVWKGRINNNRVELKVVQNGDSITGTSYYHGLINNYRRYSIKGYFDQNTNSVVWRDDELIATKGTNTSNREWFSVADFDCPGSGRMYLDGKASSKDDREDPKATVSLTKTDDASFKDEWDFIIDNYTRGGNDPVLIDSVSRIAFQRKPEPRYVNEPKPQPEKIILAKQPIPEAQPKPTISTKAPEIKVERAVVISKPIVPLTIDEMFTIRKKIFNTEIPLSGDSIELRFYDNAEVDGDSISLFLNDKLIFTNIKLTGNPYTIKLSVNDLQDENELVMVAENLGAIPPNTSFMIAIAGDKRYEAQLESTEKSSSLIRLKKTPK